ncbi:hypothetical protein OH799_08660 [Nocardia sp. NBC_00881]|uniref:MarR family winged helix-turn-helix transcriptional regulator n=1 Tax=Nocardia sp. NBC_00881 TaxID=2975995 RepID=UPI003865F5C1|nr:hypothetical protein OH799_08660 [Nocardia sp. NBC_00881]
MVQLATAAAANRQHDWRAAETTQTSPGTAAAAQALVTAVTQHVKALADAALVTTAPDPADRRAVFVETTEAGRAELRQLLQIGDQFFVAVVADWSAEDVVTAALLDRLIESRAARDRTTKPSKHPAWQPFGWSRGSRHPRRHRTELLMSTRGFQH